MRNAPQVMASPKNTLVNSVSLLPRGLGLLVAACLALSCAARPGASPPQASPPQDLVWINGRVVLPKGFPSAESVSVVSHGRKMDSGERPRTDVDADGRFRIGLPALGIRARLDVEADHLHLPDPVRVDLDSIPHTTELRPELAGMIVAQLHAGDRDRESWKAAQVELGLDGTLAEFWSGHYALQTVDEELRATFRGVPTGTAYAVRGTPPDGFPVSVRGVLAAPGETILVELDPGPRIRVSGRVEDYQGEPVPSAEVTLTVYEDLGSGRGSVRSHYTSTDEAGRYDIVAIPSGKLTVQATAEGYRPSEVQLGTPQQGEHVFPRAIVLPDGHSVTVRVLWPDGMPVGRAILNLEGPGAWEHSGLSSLPKGVREISGYTHTYSGLGPGPYTVSATATRPAEASSESSRRRKYYGRVEDVSPGSVVDLVVRESVRVEGRWVDQTGTALTSYRLYALPDPTDVLLGSLRENVHNPAGTFELYLCPGQWRLDISGAGFGSESLTVPVSRPPLLVAEAAATYSGVVVDTAGHPVADAEIRVRHQRVQQGASSSRSATIRSATDGTWSFDAPAGVVWLEARTSMHVESDLILIRGASGETIDEVKLVVR
jgi:Carboxypeptidase regulatory-like domain